MRPPKRLEAPACRTVSSPLNDAVDHLLTLSVDIAHRG
jgi:hypothetical protein